MDHHIHEMHTYNGNIYHVTECKTFIMSSCTNCVKKVLHSINTSILHKKNFSLCKCKTQIHNNTFGFTFYYNIPTLKCNVSKFRLGFLCSVVVKLSDVNQN